MKKINLHWFGLLAITPCVVLSSNITKNEKHDKTIFKVTKTIQRFYGKSEQFKYIKKINANYLYAQYINYYAIIDRKDFSIIEIKKGNYNFDTNIEYNFLYSNKRNENNINKLRLTSNKHFFPLENDKLDKLPNISNKIKNIRNDNPVIVSTAKTMHAFIIYGFDSETQMVLLNWLWGDNDSIVLVNYWKLAAAASALKIIFTMRAKQNQKLETKKLFKYKNKMYNNEEIRKLFNEN